MNELTEKIRQWGIDRNIIGGSTSSAQFIKTVEELGELAGGLARSDKAKIKDGLGDLYVTMVLLAENEGLHIEDCVDAAYEEIKDRKGRMINGVFVKEADIDDDLEGEELGTPQCDTTGECESCQ